MTNNNEYVFRRIRGRVVKIKRRKNDSIGAAQIAAGGAVSIASGASAGKLLKKSSFAFGRSATLRGISKLSTKGSGTYSKMIKESAAFKIAGKNLAKKSSAILFLGTTVGGVLASMGANRIVREKNKDKRSLKVESIGVAVGSIGLLPFGKIGRVSKLARMAFKNKRPVSEVFKRWSAEGMKKTSSTVNKFSKAQYKGFTPKPANVYNAKQQDLFSSKKFDVKKWIN